MSDGGNLRVHGAGADQRRGAEGKESELLVDLAAILAIEFLPGQVAGAGHVRDIIGIALRIRVVSRRTSRSLALLSPQ